MYTTEQFVDVLLKRLIQLELRVRQLEQKGKLMNDNYSIDNTITWDNLPPAEGVTEDGAPKQLQEKEEVTDETPAVEKPMAM